MLTKTILATTPRRFFKWMLRQEKKVRDWLQYLVLQLAVDQAFQKFQMRHPRWVASLFDEYFLTNKAAPLLARYLQPVNPPTSAELAAAWADELGPIAPAPFSFRRIEVAMVAADFLCYLESELQRYQLIWPRPAKQPVERPQTRQTAPY